MTELTTWQNLLPLIVVTAIYGFCVVFTIVQHKRGKLLPAETDKN